jgi:hypothetical protein
MLQADQYQRETELVDVPTALRDKRQTFGPERRVADKVTLVRQKAKQPRPCRRAQQSRDRLVSVRGWPSPVHDQTI